MSFLLNNQTREGSQEAKKGIVMILKAGALSYTIQSNYTETMGSLEQINHPGKGVLMGKMGITIFSRISDRIK